MMNSAAHGDLLEMVSLVATIQSFQPTVMYDLAGLVSYLRTLGFCYRRRLASIANPST